MERADQDTPIRDYKKHPWSAGLIIIPALISGCLYYGEYGPRSSLPSEKPEGMFFLPLDPNYFAYARAPLNPEILQTRDRGTYTVQKLRFPTHTAFLYIPKDIAPAPGVVVLPISDGNYHARRLANHLAAHGFVCLRFQSRKEILQLSDSKDPLKEFERLLKTYVLDILQGIDWMTTHPVVDAERIGVAGISFGAIIGTIVAGVDPRIKARVSLLGGGDLVGILFSSKERSILAVRKSLEDQEDLTAGEIRRKLTLRLRHFEPLAYADRLDPSAILMINAYFDRVIKRRYTMNLWRASGKPRMILLPTGHYSAALFFPYAKQKTLAHFQKVLALDMSM